jgi:hypothetical protein
MQEYKDCFAEQLEILTMEPCYNSFQKRQGNELFIKLKNKNVKR